jgi:hypothetical protein
MLRRSKLILLAGAMLMAGAGQAGAALMVGGTHAAASESVPAYRTLMYSDATYTTVVGTIEPECQVRGGEPYVQYHLQGQYTYYQQDELVYYCGPWGPEPL